MLPLDVCVMLGAELALGAFLQVRGFLADYSVELEVYDYWVWRYYPDWIDWYRNQQSQASGEAPAEKTMQQSTAGDAATAGRDAATAAGMLQLLLGMLQLLLGMV